MACLAPLCAFKTDSGQVIVVGKFDDVKAIPQRMAGHRELSLPCGQCVECRLRRAKEWAIRCVHESKLYEFNSFVTLTYNEDNCPRSLVYRHFQLFMRKVRRRFPGARFYMCGEYGEQGSRPHFHACLFGVHFADRKLWSERDGIKLYRSPLLESLWEHGFSSIGDVNVLTAGYVARYIMKKITGDKADTHYLRVCSVTGEEYRVEPEFSRMSLKPGIGARWFEKYSAQVVTHDAVVVDGSKVKPPRYYDKLLKEVDEYAFDEIQFKRLEKALTLVEDNTTERRVVKSVVATARVKLLKRSL